jgi:hypothetical protein
MKILNGDNTSIFGTDIHVHKFVITESIIYYVPSVKNLINQMIENMNKMYECIYDFNIKYNKMFTKNGLTPINIEILNKQINSI